MERLSETYSEHRLCVSFDFPLSVAAFGIGIVVGLTGMGGGALMTPVLVLFFGVMPLTAVSSDLVASAVMKPVGSLIHLRRGTVHLGLVKWLCIGSVPAAFGGVLLARALGGGEQMQSGNPHGTGYRPAGLGGRADGPGLSASRRARSRS